MDDKNDGSWWGDIQTTNQAAEEQEEYEYLNDNGDQRKKFIIIADSLYRIIRRRLGN